MMELSGIELRYLVNEISAKVTSGYYVSSVNGITKDSLLLKLHHPLHEDIMLVLSVKGIWITKLKFKPVEENNIEGIAQAELERAKLESIEQAGSERIVSLRFRHPPPPAVNDNDNNNSSKVRIVVCEFFGDGNLMICDESMKIIAILKPIEVRHRTLNVGLRYSYPPARGIDVFQLTIEQMLSLRSKADKNLDVLRWIGRSMSMPRKFVEEAAKRAGIEKNKQAVQLTDSEVDKIYTAIKNLVGDVSAGGKNHEPIVIVGKDGRPEEALPIVTEEVTLKAHNNIVTIKKANSYMDAVDEVLSNEILDIGRSSKTVELDRQIALLEHDLEEQNRAREAVMRKSAAIRKFAGELMALSYHDNTSYDHNNHSNSNSIVDDDEFKKLNDVLAANSATIVREKGVKYVEIVGERIEMQPNLAKLASLLFARAKELERGNASIEQARAKILAQIEKLRSQTAAIHKKVVVQKQAAKEWYERYRWFITTDGLLAIGGRDASSNSALIRKHLTEHDIVFHAEVHGSPFFIVKNAAAAAKKGKIDPSLQQVAQATVSFSRAWKDGLSSADAYWVMPEQVKKGAPTGQFLPKGSFVIEGKRNYLKGVEIRLAIGVVQMNGGRQSLVCGPEEAVKKHSLFYAVLLQGGMDPMNAAKKVKAELVAAAAAAAAAAAGRNDNDEVVESIKRTSLDDFVRALPTGQSRISFIARGHHQQLSVSAAEKGTDKS